MMSFRIDGLEKLEASFAELAALSDETIWSIIKPAAEQLKEAMQSSIAEMVGAKKSSGQLSASIEIRDKRLEGGAASCFVGPNQRKRSRKKADGTEAKPGARKTRNGKKASNGSYSGTNAEVAFILEYGSSRIPAKHWMQTAVDDSEADVINTMEVGFDQALEDAGF